MPCVSSLSNKRKENSCTVSWFCSLFLIVCLLNKEKYFVRLPAFNYIYYNQNCCKDDFHYLVMIKIVAKIV